ncbi:aspartyl protease [Piedraia hortae CBS 480.64]|uniref:Aspartyl protease n=1 Tax=Piedraia hortae CBS 480.64 TaxID=1314780 RepID=A0A6A7CAL5_9PEZI|nr:aspartyl protease [Piedraia hortae CBS 480.64]
MVFAASALAAPAITNTLSNGIHVPQVEAGKRIKNGPAEVLKTYYKYHQYAKVDDDNKPPMLVRIAADALHNGSVAANPDDNESSYLCPVTVGNAKLHLNFDTGSSDLWVFSTLMPSSTTNGHGVYDVNQGGQQMQGSTWQISYADGSGASGLVYADKVQIGGATATRQAVEAATSISDSFAKSEHCDGLVGLAFSSINNIRPKQQKTFFDTIKDSLPQKLFTATLKHKAPGSYDFGYIDKSKYKGDIGYVPVDPSRGFWEFDAGAFSVGNGQLQGNIGKAIADTGTTLLYVPENVASAYYSQVNGASMDGSQGGYTFPCNTQLPPFNIQIGAKTITVPGNIINFATAGQGTCFGGIQPSQQQDLNIFGDIFLKAVYTVFDMTQGKPRLGFAQQA